MTADYIPLTDAITLLPKRNGKRIHVQTMVRWIKRGCRGVKLTARKVGWHWYTTPEWLEEFQSRCFASSMGIVERTPAKRRRDHGFAKSELKRRFWNHGSSKDKDAPAEHEGTREVLDMRSTG